MNNVFNWVINFAPVLGKVAGWFQKLLDAKLTAFLLIKAILFFLCYKYFPLLFGRFYQWIYDLGLSNTISVDLSSLTGIEIPAITGLAAWLVHHLKLDICFNIVVSGAIARLGIKSLPFLGR